MSWFTSIKKRSVQVKILLAGVLLGTSFASHACGIHDQLCVFHGVGIPRTSYDVSNPTTSLVIYARGENGSSGASKTDFDNHVLLPTTTSSSTWMGTTSTQPTGPYVDFTTSYGATNPPKVWSDPSTLPAHVYPSQYQVIFNQNTAQAVHTGDFNGGENGQIPSQYATGCLGRGTNPDCEEVVVTGNVPNGTYSQKIQFFNFYGDPNPKVDLYVGAYATGQGVLISPNHLPSDQNTTLEQTKIFNEAIKNGTSSVGDYIQLQGNQAVSKQFDYQFYNRGFDAHAVGVTLYDQNIRKNLGWVDPYWVTKENGVQEKIQQHQFRVDTKTTLVGGYGGSTVSVQKGATRVDGQRVLGIFIPPVKQPVMKGNAADLLAFLQSKEVSFVPVLPMQEKPTSAMSFGGSLLSFDKLGFAPKINSVVTIGPAKNSDIYISPQDLANFQQAQEYGLQSFSISQIEDACRRKNNCNENFWSSVMGTTLSNLQYYVPTSIIKPVRGAQNFKPPTNPPQLPPEVVPSGWRVRTMPPTSDYLNGYWKLEKPKENGDWQAINPSTMRPGKREDTHVEFPSP